MPEKKSDLPLPVDFVGPEPDPAKEAEAAEWNAILHDLGVSIFLGAVMFCAGLLIGYSMWAK